MAEILKGTISTIESTPVDEKGYPTSAKVISSVGGSVTRPLTIPWYLRSTMGNLAPGIEVVYALFEDRTGYILGRFDGNFQKNIPYDLIIDGNTTTNGESVVSGKVSAADFVSDAYGSSNAHTHTDSQSGKTTPPN